MTKQTIVLALGAILATLMVAPSFAAAQPHAVHQARAAHAHSGYYNSVVPEGNYAGFQGATTTGGYSGAIGGVGR
jgi:hypothetical protein